MTEKRVMWEGANGVANRVVLVDLSGDPVAPSGGGGGGGDATAANQVTQTTHLSNLSTTQGARADAPAASDTGTASEIAIAKRHNVLLSALMATPSDIVLDSAGTAFSPASCSHVYGYTDGNLTTDKATDGAVVRVKTLTYTSGSMTAETKWVVQ